MRKPFTTQIESALTDRANEVEEQVLIPDERYQELSAKMYDILDQIEKSLPPGKEQLLFNLDEFWTERDVMAYGRMYRQPKIPGHP